MVVDAGVTGDIEICEASIVVFGALDKKEMVVLLPSALAIDGRAHARPASTAVMSIALAGLMRILQEVFLDAL